jgi:hypothetical protein
MTKEFVPYELAVKLKALGFDEKCFCNWEESWSPEPEDEIRMVLTTDQTWLRPGWVRAPTFSQAFRWFREKHKLFVSIEYSTRSQTDFVITINKIAVNDARDEDYKTYEVAELFALDKLIEIVEIKQQEPNISEWDGPYSF